MTTICMTSFSFILSQTLQIQRVSLVKKHTTGAYMYNADDRNSTKDGEERSKVAIFYQNKTHTCVHRRVSEGVHASVSYDKLKMKSLIKN